jgi:hypothetical protein
MLSAFETPETRALFNSLRNVAGKLRTEKRWNAVQVPEGLDQVINCTSILCVWRETYFDANFAEVEFCAI